MSPHEYGIPQQRERIYFVCVRKDIYNNIPITLLPHVDIGQPVGDILEKKEVIDEKYFFEW